MNGVVPWIADHPRVFLETAEQHLTLSAVALAAAIAIGIPLGLLLVRYERAAGTVIGLVNVLRTIPSLALLVILLPVLGTGFPPSVVALTAYGLPAILINTYTGLIGVDRETVDAARGQGMTERQIRSRILVPLSLPLIFAGIRIAAVQIVSAATLAAFIGGGGFGDLITAGMGTLDIPQLVVGALAVAILAFAIELLFSRVERYFDNRAGAAA